MASGHLAAAATPARASTLPASALYSSGRLPGRASAPAFRASGLPTSTSGTGLFSPASLARAAAPAPSSSTAARATFRVLPTRRKDCWPMACRRAAASASLREAGTRTAMPAGRWNFSSWRNMTVSCPTSKLFPSGPILTRRMGGAAASDMAALASSVTCGQSVRARCLAATCMAKAMQVGRPQSLQLVLGRFL